jgi:hypothetical protein
MPFNVQGSMFNVPHVPILNFERATLNRAEDATLNIEPRGSRRCAID